MKIIDVEIRACSVADAEAIERVNLHGGHMPDVTVITLHTDEGISGTSFGFGGLDARATSMMFQQLVPFFLGRDPLAREKNAREFRRFDRSWNHVPIWAYGPFDNACWDIAGKRAAMPIFDLVGRSAERAPVYVSSMFMGTTEEYVAQALEVKGAGFKAYKLHPPGNMQQDLEICTAVRDAVGPDFRLMSDPVAVYTFDEALRMGRHLEELNFYWFEEPLYDYDMASLAKLSDALDIPIAGTETLIGQHQLTAQYVAARAVDIVRTDASWRGGITSVLKTAHLAESFGLQCEIHTTIYHPLELANLQCVLSISNSEYFELLYPMDQFSFGLKTPLDIRDGYIYPPAGPGLGADYDWDAIDNATVAHFTS
jgi:L-alanine-DL-glutamate epimerase-like enolase superfamily enzyme